ncbi:transcription termination factor 3, mitochondrial isoform X2 [Betta splendens]|uniref:Transcription termination factor 3, mitochondrial n=1 Tax=Betta splendens TaxID=158456 RepID=A0A6P7NYE1_BETSP|nr:transcription termination factor 3, mitochondrial isoform X2 [Betta splendens]
MASSCAQLCVRCRTLCQKSLTVTRQASVQFGHSFTVIWTYNRVGNACLPIRGNHTAAEARKRWKHQMSSHTELTLDHFSTDATEEKHKECLVPISDNVPETQNAAAEFSALEEISDEEALSMCVPSAVPPASFSLRDYVDKSVMLRKLVQLGVNLWKLEQKPNVGTMLLRLDFDTDVAPKLLFLKELGVEDSRFGYIITTNPYILTESLENLQTRVNYLKSKKFSSETVASMVSRAPYLLNFSVKRLDNRLGFYQQQLNTSASNTRNIVARLPRLLCGSLEPVKENLKVCQIELGFKQNEIQHIVFAVPKVLTANKGKLTQIFDFLHNNMKVPHHLIAKFPQVLNSKYLRIRERHLFLEYLGRAQYDPALPNYISLDRLVSLPDEPFCTELASATLEDYYLFQKTL